MNHTRVGLLAAAVIFLGLHNVRAAEKEGIPLTDEEVLKRVYDKDYRTPKGFYEDPALKKPNVSLYYHQPGWFADDKDAARKIVQDFLDKPSNIEVRKIQETAETKMSFDFRGGGIWYRVHKPGFFAWTGRRVGEHNLNLPPDGTPKEIGRFKAKLSKDVVKAFAEYDWLIANYNMGGAKVLASETKEDGDNIVHVLHTTAVTFGDFGLNDEVRVLRVTYAVSKKDGTTTKAQKAVKTLTGKRN
jgi:hypothetical protein